MLCEEVTNTNLIVFCFTRSGLDTKIYHPRGNHYTTDVVYSWQKYWKYVLGNDNNNIFVMDNMSEYTIDDFPWGEYKDQPMEHDIHRDIRGEYNVPWVDQSLYSPKLKIINCFIIWH